MEGLDIEKLKSAIHYDSETGVFTWAKNRKGVIAGTVAGHKTDQGYTSILVFRKRYKAHRLAWFYVYGEWPNGEIDHINGERCDNRIANLRQATHLENRSNSKTYANNTTGFKGVYFNRKKRKWVAQITRNGTNKYLGIFNSPEEAHVAYCNAGLLASGKFFNPGTQSNYGA